MSASTEPMTAVKRYDASAVKGHYQRIVRHRLVIMGVIVLAILASLILISPWGHQVYPSVRYGKRCGSQKWPMRAPALSFGIFVCPMR